MSKKILIVDDDVEVRDTLKALLKMEGYSVIVACDGPEAVAQAEAEIPDLILLDRVMPKMDGLEVVKILRSNRLLAGTVIVMLTARADMADMEQAWDAGSDLYLTKPFAAVELLANLKEILAPRA